MRVSALERVQSRVLLAPRRPEALRGKRTVLGGSWMVFSLRTMRPLGTQFPAAACAMLSLTAPGKGGLWPSERQHWGLGPLP